MGVKERLARANWELNCMLRTGRIPKHRSPTPYYPGNVQYSSAQIACKVCGSQIPFGSKFCDRCGAMAAGST